MDCVAETLRRTLARRARPRATPSTWSARCGSATGWTATWSRGTWTAWATSGRCARRAESAVLEVAAPAALLRYVVEKGSITVDGVSLTVAARLPDAFTVALIPHTMAVTTLGPQALERPVNLEVDVVAKYVESLAAPYAPEGTGG